MSEYKLKIDYIIDYINENEILNRYGSSRKLSVIKTFIFLFAVCLVKQTGDNGFRINDIFK